MQPFRLTVLDEALSFRSAADVERLHAAKDFVEKQYAQLYAQLENRGGPYSRNALLSLLILGIADEMLASHDKLDELSKKMTALLDIIDTNI